MAPDAAGGADGSVGPAIADAVRGAIAATGSTTPMAPATATLPAVPGDHDTPAPARRGPVPWPALAVLAGLFSLGAALTWWSIPAGPLSGNDSVTYLAVARNIAGGHGVTSPFGHELTGLSPVDGAARLGAQPLTAWPPLYPLALAAGTPAGLTVETVSRLLNVLAAGATGVLTALVARRLGACLLAAAVAAVAVLVNVSAALVFATAGSDALYLPLAGGARPPLDRAAGRPPRGAVGLDLAIVSAAAAAATLTRHVGLALIITGIVVLRGSGVRAWRVVGLASLALAPAGAALVWSRRQPGWRSGPSWLSPSDELANAGRALSQWIVPGHTALAATGVVALVVLVGLAVAGAAYAIATDPPALFGRLDAMARAGEGPAGAAVLLVPARRVLRRRRTMLVTLGVHAIAYVGVVLLGTGFVDHGIPFDRRLALPLLPTAMAVVAAGGDLAMRRIAIRRTRVLAIAAIAVTAIVLAGVNAQHSREQIWSRSVAGVWTPAPRYPAMDALRALPPDVVVFANQPSAAFALSGRPVLALPLKRSPMTGLPNPRAERDLDQLVEMIRSRRAVVVIDRPTAWLLGVGGQPLATDAQLRARVPLRTLAEDERFAVLG